MKRNRWFLLLLLASAAMACGGSGGGAGAVPLPDDDDNDGQSPGDDDAVADGDNDDDDSATDDDASDDDASPDDDDNDAAPIWTDPTSGLLWQNGPGVGADNFAQGAAEIYCPGLNWGGYDTGWQMPGIDQLRSLIRGCAATETGGSCGVTDDCADASCWNVHCNGCPESGGPGLGGAYWPPGLSGSVGRYWSSLAVGDDPADGWAADFSFGLVADYEIEDGYYVRCVHP
jgi:hypothetical protein